MLGILLVMVFAGDGLVGAAARPLPYSAFKGHLRSGEVQECRVGPERIRGVVQPSPGEGRAEPEAFAFETVRVEDPALVEELERAGIEYTGERPSTLFQGLLVWLLPLGILLLFWSYLFRRMGPGGAGAALSFGKSKAHLVADRDTGVDFSDVAGCDEAVADLEEVVEFLRHPDRYRRLGAKIPKGLLLLGPPGTGKTLLARAVAGEAQVPFYSISGSNFVEMFVGVGAARVRDLFREAHKNAPCIVFIDEIDAIGRQRSVHMSAVNDEREQTLNQLLVELDGFEPNSGVILLAATNRPDVLDRALLRPGRFDRQVVLDVPDAGGREAILRVHARGKPLADDVSLGAVARATPGFAGADLANALNEAALLAARRGGEAIDAHDVQEAIEKLVAGPERKSRRLREGEKRRVAFHEAGHAVVARHCPYADPVHKISIVPRGRGALGWTMQLPQEDVSLMSRAEMEDRLAVLLGGRAAELLVLGEASTGAADDLERATSLVRQMVCIHGMGESVGLMRCAHEAGGDLRRAPFPAEQRDCSDATAAAVDAEVRALLDRALERASRLIEDARPELERVASALVERESLDAAALEELLAEGSPLGGAGDDGTRRAGSTAPVTL